MRYFKTSFIIKCKDLELVNAFSDDVIQTARELVSDIAGECGYESFMDTDEGIDGFIQQDLYHEESLRTALADLPLADIEVTFTTEAVEDQDWNETWEQEEGFSPIVIDKHLVIYDALHTDPNQLDNTYSIEIGIRARNAFGTGTHETTQMILSTLLSLPLEGRRVLDCGCGTGILGIAALKCGCHDVVAYDIDEWSVENTKYNAILNGVGDQIEVYEGDSHILSHVSGVFDVVLANINRNILLADFPVFREMMNVGATLVLSGFYEEDVPLLVEKAESLGLTLQEKKSNGDWRCLIFR